MTKKQFEKAVFELFGIKADYPFDEDFETAVFRHPDTKKWFAICMNIKRTKLGLTGDGELWIVNLKCEPEIIESLAGVEVGIFRAYHMNKRYWLTASLDMCDEDMIVWLLEKSYTLTKKISTRRG